MEPRTYEEEPRNGKKVSLCWEVPWDCVVLNWPAVMEPWNGRNCGLGVCADEEACWILSKPDTGNTGMFQMY